MALQFSTTHRTNSMSDIIAQLGPGAIVKWWTGSPPATPATADTGTLLVTFTLNATTIGTSTNGVLTFNGTAAATAATSANPIGPVLPTTGGTVGYFRAYPAAATATNAVIQGTVGTTGTDMIVGSTTISTGVNQQINTWSITENGA